MTDLRRLLDRAPSAAELDDARRLFARVLDAPGGLGIETIHAFCQSLLRRFPVEAGVAPHFELMDERDATELLSTVREEVLAAARAGGDAVLAGAVTTLAQSLGEEGFSRLLDAIAASRSRFRALLDREGGIGNVLADLARHLDLPAGTTEARVIADACAEAAFDGKALRAAASAMQGSKAKTDQSRGADLAAWLADPAGRAERFEDYLDCFFTKDGAPRANVLTKTLAAANPAALAASACRDATPRRRARAPRRRRRCWRRPSAVVRLAGAILEAYGRHKQEPRGPRLRGSDRPSIELLERPGVAPWVLFKLDGGLDHLLIDEAQDTNPDQWRVVQALTAEFFAGTGARDRRRTVFAVGDAKQSIFSFQGADPQAFLGDARAFRRARPRRARRAGARSVSRPRSAPPTRCCRRWTRSSRKPRPWRAWPSTACRSVTCRIAPVTAAVSRSGRSWRRRRTRSPRAGRCRSSPAPPPSRRRVWRRQSRRRSAAGSTTRKDCRRATAASRRATSWCWCAGARPSSPRWCGRSRTATCPSPASTACASPSSSPSRT